MQCPKCKGLIIQNHDEQRCINCGDRPTIRATTSTPPVRFRRSKDLSRGMPKEKKVATGYLDKIPSLDSLFRQYQASPTEFEGRPVGMRNRFLRIEALLRSDDAEKAFNQGGAEGHRRFFQKYGFEGDPLDGSHHDFLTKAWKELTPGEEVKELGQVDNQFGILDLAAIARLTPQTITTRGKISWGGYDGEQQILHWLRNPDPRYVYLRLDVSRPLKKIAARKKVRSLFTERYDLFEQSQKQSNRKPSKMSGAILRPLASPYIGPPEPQGNALSYAFLEQLNTRPFVKSIGTWLEYFRCFASYKKMIEPNFRATVAKLYGTENKAAFRNAQQTLKRVREMIKAMLENRFPIIR